MRIKEEKIAEAKIMLKAMGLSVEDLLENKVNSSQDAPKFLDIQKINGVPCMYLRQNEETLKKEWLCLEIPDTPTMSWEDGLEWCKSKGGNYGKIFTLQFISERRSEINQVLESKGYPKIEVGWHWSTKGNGNYSWTLGMYNGNIYYGNKNYYNYVRAFVTTD